MAAMFLATLLVIYPLSIGPAYLLDFKLREKTRHLEHGSYGAPSDIFIFCYNPILRLMEKYPSISAPVEWYLRLWFPPSERD